jgi:O-antigen ligase
MNQLLSRQAGPVDRTSFFLLCAYLLFEYGRPQSLIPGLSYLHLPLIIWTSLLIRILTRRFYYRLEEIRYFIALVVIMFPQVFFVRNNYWAFWDTYMLCIYGVAGMGMILLIKDLEGLIKLVSFWTVTFVLLAIVGLAHGGKVTDSASLGDENDFALAMNIATAFIVFQIRACRTNRARILYTICLGITLMSMVYTKSRGGLVGFIPVAIYCWINMPRKITSLVIAFLLIAIVLIRAPQAYWEKIQLLKQGTEETTGQLRLFYWKTAWKMFLDNPILGVGPGNFPWRIGEYEPPGGFQGRHHGGRQAHSLYFTLVAELGLVGTILFGMIVWSLVKNRNAAMKDYKALRRSLLSKADKIALERAKCLILTMDAALIAYFFTGTFISVLYYPYLWLIFGFSAALRLRLDEMVVRVREESAFAQEEYLVPEVGTVQGLAGV